MKRLIALLCAGMMLLSLTACNGDTAETTTTQATTTTAGGDADTTTTTADGAVTTTTSESTTDNSTTAATTTATEAKTDAKTDPTTSKTTEPTTAKTNVTTTTTAGVRVVEDASISNDAGAEILNAALEKSVLNEGNQVRLAKVFKKAAAGEKINIAFIGGSITQGTAASSTNCYAILVGTWIQNTFPDVEIGFVNAGIGATGSFIGVHRADEDLLASNPDLVFVEFAVNDTTPNLQRDTNSYDSLLRKIWKSANSPAIVTIMMTQEDGTSVQSAHAAVAESYDLPVISYHDAILDVINKGLVTWSQISPDNIHPNVKGHNLLANLIIDYLRDIVKNRNTISGNESSFATAYTDDLYSTAAMYGPAKLTAKSIGSWDAEDSRSFGGFEGYWNFKADAGASITSADELVFEVNAKAISIFYGMKTREGGKFKVEVDGTVVKTINTDFSGGWGNYVEASEVIDFASSGKHTVKIIPVESATKQTILISSLGLAK